MIVLFTDFGHRGPYVGQLHALLQARAPDVARIDLMHDAPPFNPRASAYLLAALLDSVPEGAIVVAVVDPGVGTERAPVLVDTGRHRLIGPDNGLFALAARRASNAVWSRITVPEPLASATFHGRDLFAPAAAALALHDHIDSTPLDTRPVGHDWPEAVSEIIYVDGYGNAWTGLPASEAAPVQARGQRFRPVRTFGEAPAGTAICYANSSGLLELAISGGSAAATLALAIGDAVSPADD